MKHLKYLALIPILFVALFFIGIRVGKSLHARADLIATVKPGSVWARDFPRKHPFEDPKTSLYTVKAVALDYVQYAYTFNTRGITNIADVPDVDTLDYFIEKHRHATHEDFEREWPTVRLNWITNAGWTTWYSATPQPDGARFWMNRADSQALELRELREVITNRLCALEAWKAKHEEECWKKPKQDWSIPPGYFQFTNWQSIPAIPRSPSVTNITWFTNSYWPTTPGIIGGEGVSIRTNGSNSIVIEGKWGTVTNVIRKNWNTLELP